MYVVIEVEAQNIMPTVKRRARDQKCSACGILRHFASVCKKKESNTKVKCVVETQVYNVRVRALVVMNACYLCVIKCWILEQILEISH